MAESTPRGNKKKKRPRKMNGNDLTSVELLNFTEDMQELGKPVEVKVFLLLGEKRFVSDSSYSFRLRFVPFILRRGT